MQHTPVTSSDIRSVGYDLGSQTLEILFNSGGLYQYYGVPQQVYAGLMQAASHGRYFHAFIKDLYRYRRIQ